MLQIISLSVGGAALAFSIWWYIQQEGEEEKKRVQRRQGIKLIREIHDAVEKQSPSAEKDGSELGDATYLHGVFIADLNNDGIEEIAVESAAGAHGTRLHVFSWQDGIDEIGTLWNPCPAGFEAGDFDGDGEIEIKTEEPYSPSPNTPYASTLRERVLYHFRNGSFVPEKRIPLFQPEEAERIREKYGKEPWFPE